MISSKRERDLPFSFFQYSEQDIENLDFSDRASLGQHQQSGREWNIVSISISRGNDEETENHENSWNGIFGIARNEQLRGKPVKFIPCVAVLPSKDYR